MTASMTANTVKPLSPSQCCDCLNRRTTGGFFVPVMAQPRCSDPIPSGPWDVVVIGAGAAGLMTCLDLPAELKVLLLNRNTGRRSSSRWAQGGIAAVTRKEDSAESHAEDTRSGWSRPLRW